MYSKASYKDPTLHQHEKQSIVLEKRKEQEFQLEKKIFFALYALKLCISLNVLDFNSVKLDTMTKTRPDISGTD